MEYFIALASWLEQAPAFISSLEWRRLEWLWFLVFLPLIAYLIAKRLLTLGKWSHWIKEPMLSFLVKNKQSYFVSPTLLFIFIILITIALLGPAEQMKNDTLKKSKTPIFIVLDLSLSMLSEDVSPSRLDFARYRITDILRQQKDGLISLVVYSGSAHIVTPLTEDIETILFQLPKLHPEIMPVYGANPVEAFELIAQSLEQLSNPAGRIVWLSDEANDKEITQAANISAQHNQELVMVMIGTEEGAAIPISTGLLYDASNNPAISETPITSMKLSALQNGIRHYQHEDLDITLINSLSQDFLVQERLQSLKEKKQIKQWHELGYWLNIPLLLLLIFLMRSRIL